jgi:hypothetical protein
LATASISSSASRRMYKDNLSFNEASEVIQIVMPIA